MKTVNYYIANVNISLPVAAESQDDSIFKAILPSSCSRIFSVTPKRTSIITNIIIEPTPTIWAAA